MFFQHGKDAHRDSAKVALNDSSRSLIWFFLSKLCLCKLVKKPSYLGYLGMEKGHKRASTEVTSVASWRTSGDAGRTVGTALARRPQIGEHMAARRAVVSHARMQQSRPPGYREESDEASITEGIGGGDERWRVAPDGLVETAAWRQARAKWCQPDAAQAAAMRPYFASSKRRECAGSPDGPPRRSAQRRSSDDGNQLCISETCKC